ncbi:MAG: hypothetical protein WEG36_04430 [Gemmatimonadota bacterium]
MRPRSPIALAVALVLLVSALWLGQGVLQRRTNVQAAQAPRFTVDPFWPKPLPNNWRLGSAIGVWVDDQDPPRQFRNPVHCADRARDGLVYVCDRQANRIQVFEADGTFVQEAFFAPRSLRSGSTWDIAFSQDPAQRYLYLVDGVNEKVRVVLRETLEELTNFGAGGRQPGQFFGVHSIATDSQGTIYTTETYEGKRIQRFVNMGEGPVTVRDQGVPWPEP